VERDSRSKWIGKGALEELMRERIRGTIEAIVEEELDETLGAARSQRVGANRTGYRHGKRPRTLSTSLSATTIMMPRARIDDDDGRRGGWRSTIIPRYQRRTERVDEAILGVYLSGTNTRRLRGALAHCCAAHRCRRTQCRAWSGGCARTLQRGRSGTSPS
jgi:putative transposase